MKRIVILLAFLLNISAVSAQGPNEHFPLPDNPSVIATGNIVIDGYINQAAMQNGLDPLLLYAQIKQESQFKVRAKSHKGARGLMQLMPETAKRFGVKNPYNVRQNIFAGAGYMRWLIEKFDGDIELALAGYNAGEGAVIKYGYNIPPYKETRKYVTKIMEHYNVLLNYQKQLSST